MKNIWRVIGCTLALVCVTSAISGCGNLAGKTNETTKEAAPSESETTATVETETKTTEETTAEAEDVIGTVEKNGIISLSTSTVYDYKYDSDNITELYAIKYNKIHINSNTKFESSMIMKEDAPALAKALDEYNKKKEQVAAEYSKNFQEYTVDGIDSGYEYTSDIYVQRADKHMLSILNESYDYQGGAHGMRGSIGYNYEPGTGKELVLSDVVNDTKLLSDILYDKVMSQYKDELFEGTKSTIDSMIADDSLPWTMGYDRMTCYFLQYAIAPYSSGTITVELPFAEYPELINSKYFDVPESYAFQIPNRLEYNYDLDGDGKYETIMPSCDYGDYGEMSNLWVSVDGNKASAEAEAYETYPTFVHMANGKNYLYIQTSEMDDYRNIYVFELSNTPKYVDNTNGISSLTYENDDTEYLNTVINDPSCMELETRSDIVGTHSIYKTFYTDNNGMPVSDDTEYAYSDTTLQITSKIPVVMTDEDGKEVTLPAGTVFDVLYTDNETKVGLRSDSKIYIQTFEQSKDPNYDFWRLGIDGKDVSDVFDGIMYAG